MKTFLKELGWFVLALFIDLRLTNPVLRHRLQQKKG